MISLQKARLSFSKHDVEVDSFFEEADQRRARFRGKPKRRPEQEDDEFFYADPNDPANEQCFQLAYFGDEHYEDDDITNDLPLNRPLQDNLSGDRSVPCPPEDEFDKLQSVHQVLYSMRDKFSCNDDSLMGFSDKKSEEHDCPLLDDDYQERHSA